MSEEAFKKFQKYDFTGDEEWQNYLKNIFPTPSSTQLQKIKRRWYQKNVDSKFDPDYGNASPQDAGENESKANTEQNNTNNSSGHNQSECHDHSHHNHSHNHSHQHGQQTRASPPGFITRALFNIEGYLKFCFMTSIFGFQAFSTTIAVTICILALIRQGKRPRFNKEYARKIVFNEYFHDLLYIVPFFIFPNQKTIFYYLPLVVHFWVGLTEFLRFKGGKLYDTFKKYVDLTHNNKGVLMTQKSKIEVYILIFLIILFLMGKSAILMIIFYANFLRIKYIINDYCKAAFKDIDSWVNPRCQSTFLLRWPYNKIRQLCAYLVKVNIPQPKNQSGTN